MKKLVKILVGIVLSVVFFSCELDNYNSPDAKFFGSILDETTNEPIQQDLIEGSRIELIEQGFENPNIRQIRFHSDGTFRENNLFSGQYEVQALRGNFFPTAKTIIDINGKTEYNFLSSPYIRIKNTDILFDEIRGVVNATFSIEQVSTSPVKLISLFADRNVNVSNTMRAAMISKDVNAVVSEDQVFKLQMSTENFISGKEYFFRIGALISGISEAKPNYSSPIRLLIDNSQVIPDLPIPGKVIDACESLDGWESGGFTLSLDSDKKEGNYSIKVTGQGVVLLQKKFDPFDTEVTKESGYLAFDLYVENTEVFGAGDSQFEITSSGGPDVNEVNWNIGEMQLFNGWNKVELSLAKAGSSVDLKAINFLRWYHTGLTGPVQLKIDNIRFYEK